MSRVLLIVLLTLTAAAVSSDDCCVGMRGNIDSDPANEITISDLVYLVSYMFSAGPAPQCAEEADIDGNGAGPDIADLVHLVNYMFAGGPAPADCPWPTPDSVILALDVGNQFLSHVVEYDRFGAIVNEFDATTTVLSDTVINNWLWYLVDDPASGLSGIWTNKYDGAWSYFPDSTPSEALALRYPATAGQSYAYYDLTVTVESINTSVTVPAGTFSCYYYRMSVPVIGTIGKIWAAPNLGVVKAEMYDLYLFTTYLRARVQLLQFIPGGGS